MMLDLAQRLLRGKEKKQCVTKALVERGKSKKGRGIDGGAHSNKPRKKKGLGSTDPDQNHLQTTVEHGRALCTFDLLQFPLHLPTDVHRIEP